MSPALQELLCGILLLFKATVPRDFEVEERLHCQVKLNQMLGDNRSLAV